MAMQNIPNKRKVWQDIRPAKPQPKPSSESQILKNEPKKKLKLPKLSKKSLLIILITAVALLITGACLWYFFIYQKNTSETLVDNSQNNQTQTTPKGANETPVLSKGDPEFSALLPAEKNISDFGGWTRISPNDTDPVYAYADLIDEISITVSEQTLPDSFKNEPYEQLALLAEGFHATQQLHAANDLTAYIGTSVDGPQSVIFIKKDVLIMIKSSKIIKSTSWVNYINSLE